MPGMWSARSLGWRETVSQVKGSGGGKRSTQMAATAVTYQTPVYMLTEGHADDPWALAATTQEWSMSDEELLDQLMPAIDMDDAGAEDGRNRRRDASRIWKTCSFDTPSGSHAASGLPDRSEEPISQTSCVGEVDEGQLQQDCRRYLREEDGAASTERKGEGPTSKGIHSLTADLFHAAQSALTSPLSNAYCIMKTCKACRRKTKTSRKAVKEAADPEHCTHPEVDHRGSARGARCAV